MKIAIAHGGDTGFVKYNEGNHEIMVTHPNEKVRNTVRHYLTTARDFTVSGSKINNHDEVGNRLLLNVAPKDASHYMLMGLSEMRYHTGVSVDWEHEDNIFTDTADPNAGADKPIVKSIDGDEYEIIN